MTNIYVLEKEGMPFYIGKANNVNKRFYNHKYKFGKNINIFIIDYIEGEEWKYWESYWIEQFKQWGFTLLNKNKGGGGCNYMSDDIKERISINNKGKIKNIVEILQFNIQGEFIKEWKSVNEAADYHKVTAANISNVINHKNRLSKGFIFIRKEEFSNELLDKKIKFSNKNKFDKILYQFDLDGNLIKIWDNIRDASQYYIITVRSILNAIKGKNSSCINCLWINKDKYSDELLINKIIKAKEHKYIRKI